MLVTKRCIKAQTYAKTSNVAGAHCYEGRPCIDGLTCSTSGAWNGSGMNEAG